MRPLSVPAFSSMTALTRVGLTGGHRGIDSTRQLLGRRCVDADTAESLHHLVVTGVLDEHRRGDVGTARRIDVGAAVDAVVVEDDHADRQVVAADRFDFHAGETESAVTLDREHRLAGLDRSGNGKAHADPHDAPGANVEALARLVHVDDAAREVEGVGAFVDEDSVGTLLDQWSRNAPSAA